MCLHVEYAWKFHHISSPILKKIYSNVIMRELGSKRTVYTKKKSPRYEGFWNKNFLLFHDNPQLCVLIATSQNEMENSYNLISRASIKYVIDKTFFLHVCYKESRCLREPNLCEWTLFRVRWRGLTIQGRVSADILKHAPFVHATLT